MNRFEELFRVRKPLIGMIHLPPLPDYALSPGIDEIFAGAVLDLQVLEQFGVDGVLVENEYDRPHRVLATAATVDAMTAVTTAVVDASRGCVVGCEILLNDPRASLDVAKASGARFVRTDYFVDRMSRPEFGEFAIDPEGLMSYRHAIGADDVLILADIQVKYAVMLEQRTLGESAALASRHRADAVIVSGDATGDAPTVESLSAAVEDAQVPVIIGSGLDATNAELLLAHCNGAIVGTALMEHGHVDGGKLGNLMGHVMKARRA